MRISELLGYKSRPEYRAVKDSEFIFGYGGLKDKLTDLGYRQYEMGSGLYGLVYARPEDDYVVKIFAPDQGYRRYLDYMQSNLQNPYVPKLRGRPVKLPRGFTLVRIEKLREIDAKLYNEIRYLETPRGDVMYRAARKQFEDRYPQFLNLLDELKDISGRDSRIAFDIHSGNIMQRGSLPVVTDPFVQRG